MQHLEGRHPGTVGIARYFEHGHLPEPLKTVSMYSYHLAEAMIAVLPDGPELTTGLRKLYRRPAVRRHGVGR